ncbi:hypothetical protein [Arthrobacter sp. StoSoilB13]|uniref:hypothetical protein n=1 Tax=Arthrobacter sp. StoSoilB13 TaxID=2830993 RepID=UPI001CC5F93D|nr:hypothetical protein [Arthrobacter sp. StoSoilB13]BCW50837.1 hypothetical protein StoSoilB13_31790 [Arthrobacter sp. StoSoilB13]
MWPEGRVRWRAGNNAGVAWDRYFARSLSGAETRRFLIWLMAAVRAFTADARPAPQDTQAFNRTILGLGDRFAAAAEY